MYGDDVNQHRARTSDSGRLRWAADDRGAIMVLGIFMCVLLVGALWYIAGIGDTLMYRERMQEASDAVAFSTAVIEARLMNLLVMINLLMAAIESILVALNIIIYATLATALVLLGLGAALSWCGAGEALIAAGEALIDVQQEVLQPMHDDVVKPAVQDALKALHTVAGGIPDIAGTAMLAGAEEIASKYKPTVTFTPLPPLVYISGSTLPLSPVWTNLPVESGSTSVLCAKAFDALSGALDMVFSGASTILAPVKAVAMAVGINDYFCELGGSSSAPDPSALQKQVGSTQCGSNQDIQTQCQTATSERQALGPLEAQCGYSGDTPPDPVPANQPAQCASLSQQISQADGDQSQCDQMKKSCQDGANSGSPQCGNISDSTLQARCQSAQTSAQNNLNSSSSSNNGGMEPTRVKKSWHNGINDAQLLAIVNSDGQPTKLSPKFVAIASQNKITAPDPTMPSGQLSSWSQAEMFYDCSAAWTTCDDHEESMWNFYWRARFRLVNLNIFGIGAVQPIASEVLWGKQIGIDAVKAATKLKGMTPAKIQLAVDLPNVIPPGTPSLH